MSNADESELGNSSMLGQINGEGHTAFSVSSRKVTAFRLYLFAAVAISVYLVVHLLTLARSPLPWFDDTFFASVTESLQTNGDLRLLISPLWFDKPVYIYGPVYFFITGTFTALFGFDIFQFRLPALLFSFGIVVVAFLLLRQQKVSPRIAAVACALLALDPTFYRGMHTGRMDSTALFFILLGLLFLFKSQSVIEKRSFLYVAMSGLSAGVSLLTTPRPAYLVGLVGGVLFMWFLKRPSREYFLKAGAWAAFCFSPWLAWFFHAFGNIPALLNYYATLPGGTYVGGFHVRLEHYPLLAAIIILMIGQLRAGLKFASTELLLFSIGGIVGYYLLVHDEGGAYAFFMVPLAYLAIGCLARQWEWNRQQWLPAAIVGGLLLVNGLTYLSRNTFIWLEWEARDAQNAEEAVAALIPRGSTVIGDDKYYFAVKKNGSDFQYLWRGGSLSERIAYHKNVYHPDFLITVNNGESETVKTYREKLNLVKVGAIETPTPGIAAQWIASVARRFGYLPDKGYGGTVWKRQKKM
ncbi:MAG: glycosyltransferase family 39 protein [Pseudomonadota bacterium]